MGYTVCKFCKKVINLENYDKHEICMKILDNSDWRSGEPTNE